MLLITVEVIRKDVPQLTTFPPFLSSFEPQKLQDSLTFPEGEQKVAIFNGFDLNHPKTKMIVFKLSLWLHINHHHIMKGCVSVDS